MAAEGGRSKTAPAKLTGSAKQTEAMRLRVLGYSLEEIAQRVGYSGRAAVHNAITSAMKRREKPVADELAALELDRLERATLAVMQQVERAVDSEGKMNPRKLGQITLALVRIQQQRARYVQVYATDGTGLGAVASLLEKLVSGPGDDDPMTMLTLDEDTGQATE